jgi:hypothetical protein
VYRSPFEPVIPPEAPPADIPPGGAQPYEDTPERPLPSASAAEPGDSEPWGGVLPLSGLVPESGDVPSPAETTVVQPLPPAGKPKRGSGRRR